MAFRPKKQKDQHGAYTSFSPPGAHLTQAMRVQTRTQQCVCTLDPSRVCILVTSHHCA